MSAQNDHRVPAEDAAPTRDGRTALQISRDQTCFQTRLRTRSFYEVGGSWIDDDLQRLSNHCCGAYRGR